MFEPWSPKKGDVGYVVNARSESRSAVVVVTSVGKERVYFDRGWRAYTRLFTIYDKDGIMCDNRDGYGFGRLYRSIADRDAAHMFALRRGKSLKALEALTDPQVLETVARLLGVTDV